jgi:predicted amidohydrolase YtcJ
VIVLDRNLFAAEPSELKNAKTDVNIFYGRIIYTR